MTRKPAKAEMRAPKKAVGPTPVEDDRRQRVLRSIDDKLGKLAESSARLEKIEDEILEALQDISVHTGLQNKISLMILIALRKDKPGMTLDEARSMVERGEWVGEGSGHQDVPMTEGAGAVGYGEEGQPTAEQVQPEQAQVGDLTAEQTQPEPGHVGDPTADVEEGEIL